MYQAVKIRNGKWLIEDTTDGDRTTIPYRTKREAMAQAADMNAWVQRNAERLKELS